MAKSAKQTGTKPARRRAAPAPPEFVHTFLIVLIGVDPLVWRRIQVPTTYSFWDLHVAIQDAMGWQDCHLHEFRLSPPHARPMVSIGIPTGEESADQQVLPGWKVPLSDAFEGPGLHADPMIYAYDFGDDWEHVLIHEGTESADPARRYPRCVSGARRCPPEDCGGAHGYASLLEVLADPRHPEHEEMREWAGDFDAEAFDAAAVTFDDPKRRLKNVVSAR